MKAYMYDHVEAHRTTMFQESVDEVKRQLEDMVKDVEETLADRTDEVFIQIKRDYRSVLGGEDVPQGEVLTRVQRLVRKEMKKTIDGAERMINVVLGYEVEDLPDPVEDAEDATTGKQERDGANDDVKKQAEDKELPDLASISTDVKQETSDTLPPLPQPSASSASPRPEGSDSATAGVKEEDEDNTESANVTNADSRSDAASDSEAEEAKNEDASSDGD